MIGAALLFLLSCTALAGCASGNRSHSSDPISRSDFILNTYVTITIYDTSDESVLDGALELCADCENIFSRTLPGSELWDVNHRAADEQTLTVSDDMATVIEKGIYYSALTDGAFDITIEPLSSLWDFTSQEAVIPDVEDISARAAMVDYHNVVLSGNNLTFLSPDTTLDLGGIAKGYIADAIKKYLESAGVSSAIINLGGDVLCVGEKPDGSGFKIGLQMPFSDHSDTFATVEIKDLSVVGSGVYERNFFVDGKNYHHILNPSTGYPYDNGLIGINVISDTAIDGDALATALFSLGLEEGLKLADSLDGVYACFIDEDYNTIYSDGFEQFLTAQ